MLKISKACQKPKPTERPFEWLTSAESLRALLDPNGGLSQAESDRDDPVMRSALHLGCGDSMLGEFLAEELNFGCVVNVDRDEDALNRIKGRQERNCNRGEELESEPRRMEFIQIDFNEREAIDQMPREVFDLAVDKSTLDCVMCSNDFAAAGLLCLAHNSLTVGGIYVVVSFHDVNFLSPLLRDCPGVTWTVEHHVIPRTAEASVSLNAASFASDSLERESHHQVLFPSLPLESSDLPAERQDDVDTSTVSTSVWSSGTFDPKSNGVYHKYVNVLICRKESTTGALDRDLVHQHIQSCNNHWFQNSNPMMTPTREERLKNDWIQEESCASSCEQFTMLELTRCYSVMFTEAEREHLTFEHFMEDWGAFLDSRASHIPRDKMSFETAVEFLKEMQ